MQAHQSKHSIGGSTRRERERERERERMCVFFLNFVSFLLFFTLDFKVCVDLCKIKKKKSDRTRCLAISILEYNINWN